MEEKIKNDLENIPAEEGELSDEELEGAAGGFGYIYPSFRTIYYCGNCGEEYLSKPKKCSKCCSEDIKVKVK